MASSERIGQKIAVVATPQKYFVFLDLQASSEHLFINA
jgi:hypothetical protein